MAGAVKHMEHSHRATALKRHSGAFNQFCRNARIKTVAKQQKKMTLGQMLKGALKRDTRKES